MRSVQQTLTSKCIQVNSLSLNWLAWRAEYGTLACLIVEN